MRTLLLLDVDGVLIQPRGYKIALRDTVDYFAGRMGLASVHLSFEDIAIFEACGMTNEWDSAAFCVGALLTGALHQNGDLQRATFEATLEAIRAWQVVVPRPDFAGLAHQVAARNHDHAPPTMHCLDVLKANTRPEYYSLLHALFDDIYAIDTPTTRIQQNFTLGHLHFAKTYQQVAPLECDSYLIQYDTPIISAVNIQRLLDWGQELDHGLVVYTARPSAPPEGNKTGYAPEADLAAELLGLSGKVPLIASGKMDWLARQYGRKAADYIKPSPVQALAAIGAALCGEETAALRAAAILFEQKRLVEPLWALANEPTRIIVFDDSTGGLHATRLAVEQLCALGLEINLEMVGVAPEASKQAALKKVANRIVNDVNAGLAFLFG